jgi:hypothetical protein
VPKEDPASKATESERKAGGYLERMVGAEKLVDELTGKEGYQPGNIRDRVTGDHPVVGNWLMSEKGQRYENAAREWGRAKLRFESGAVIGDNEALAEGRQYFPMPGDSPGVIAQKNQLRETAMAAMRRMAGRASPGEAPAAADGEGGGWSIRPVQ